MTIAMGTCPVCQGSTRKPVPESSQRYIKYNARWGHWGCSGYEPAGPGPFQDGQGYEGGTFPCGNCGGQTMESRATGQVPLRANGEPCAHEYTGGKAGNCYYKYQCKHCSHHYAIDSGD